MNTKDNIVYFFDYFQSSKFSDEYMKITHKSYYYVLSRLFKFLKT